MFLSKLKAVVVVAVCLSLGAIGLTYRPAQAAPRQPAQAADELAALRLEIEALRKDVQALRERVKVVEAQSRGQPGGGGPESAKSLAEELQKYLAGGEANKQDREKLLRWLMEQQKEGTATPKPKGSVWYTETFRDALKDRYKEELQNRKEQLPKAAPNVVETLERALEAIRNSADDKKAIEALERALEDLRKHPRPEGKPR
jgi:hypothetical protein